MNLRWICNYVWMDILPFFDHTKLVFIIALISDRLGALVDTHFDGKTMELTIWSAIEVSKDIGPRAKVTVRIDRKFVGFPLPYRPLPNQIRFNDIQIEYIDHSVITFLRSNKQIWDRSGTKLELNMHSSYLNVQPIWDAFTRQIWPIFTTSIRHLSIHNCGNLDNLRRFIPSTNLTDLDQLNSIDSDLLCPDAIDDYGPNATAGQILSKWLHIPSKDGQPKQLRFRYYMDPPILEWLNNFRETFRRATTSSVSYTVHFYLFASTQIVTFNLVNGRTNERLTLEKEGNYWRLKRCPNVGETPAAIQWGNDGNSDANLNNVKFIFWCVSNCIGPLSPPVEKDDEEADQSNGN